jgi:glutamate-1-semialdehyde 2,1-aminomutase
MTMGTTSMLKRDESARLFARARGLMPGGVSSPVRAFGAVGGEPVFVASAEGSRLTDADGKSYIDLVGTWGPAIAGHANPAVLEAVREAAGRGLSFGACCSLEADLAEIIAGALPSVESVRFVSSGTEATMSAVRLARGVTGRDNIVKFEGNYHGHADPFLVSAGSGAATFGSPTSPGVPASAASGTLLAPYNDADAVRGLFETHGSSIAAVIVEPVAGNMGMVRPVEGFLEALRALCNEHGALLIFDEVMTGFRVAWGGYQNACGISPDLTTLGKVIGGGMPVAAYAGSRQIMERLSPVGPVYQAGTLSGNPVGMAAGIATLSICAESGFYERLETTTRGLADGLRDAAAEAGRTVSTDAMGGMLGLAFTPAPVRDFEGAKGADHEGFGRFFQAMLRRGVWLPPSSYEAMFVSSAHTPDDIAAMVEAARESFKEIG